MEDTQEKQVFTEITTEESATINGGSCVYTQSRRRRYPYYSRYYRQTVNVYFNNY